LLLGLPLVALVWRAIGKDFSITPFPHIDNGAQTQPADQQRHRPGCGGHRHPLAYILARWKFRGRTALELLVDLRWFYLLPWRAWRC